MSILSNNVLQFNYMKKGKKISLIMITVIMGFLALAIGGAYYLMGPYKEPLGFEGCWKYEGHEQCS